MVDGLLIDHYLQLILAVSLGNACLVAFFSFFFFLSRRILEDFVKIVRPL